MFTLVLGSGLCNFKSELQYIDPWIVRPAIALVWPVCTKKSGCACLNPGLEIKRTTSGVRQTRNHCKSGSPSMNVGVAKIKKIKEKKVFM